MPVDGHAEVGRLLKSVIYDIRGRESTYKALDGVRSDLDDWAQCEYNRSELSDEVFFGLYYHEEDVLRSDLRGAARTEAHVKNLEAATDLLARYYPDCAPVRSLLKSIDKSISALRASSR